jgi:hypothetical protein
MWEFQSANVFLNLFFIFLTLCTFFRQEYFYRWTYFFFKTWTFKRMWTFFNSRNNFWIGKLFWSSGVDKTYTRCPVNTLANK